MFYQPISKYSHLHFSTLPEQPVTLEMDVLTTDIVQDITDCPADFEENVVSSANGTIAKAEPDYTR